MPKLKIAHIRGRGADLIIVPVASRFGSAPPEEKKATIAHLQERAASANLAGRVIPVWDAGGGRMGFVAPPLCYPYFMGVNLEWVSAKINRELFW